ncbi:MAG: hypothetical protein HDS99_00440 [Bacteroidales bacterium]|nr:hypothetical protein [Bacteroidales bacterium]
MAFFHTVEFYVIVAFVAAAVIALCSRPTSQGAVRTYLVAGQLLEADGGSGCGVAFHVNDRGGLEIFRYGLVGITDEGAYSLAVSVSGFDVTIKERTVAGGGATAATCGRATLDFLGAERYHFQYIVENSALTTGFYLTLKPGARADRPLEA